MKETDQFAQRLVRLFDVPVKIVNPAPLPWQQQVELMQMFSVVISPCGSISYITRFIAEGSACIYIYLYI